ncbi:MAG: hypothetical protein WCA51_05010, partial [Dehalococcoidia bacterium]
IKIFIISRLSCPQDASGHPGLLDSPVKRLCRNYHYKLPVHKKPREKYVILWLDQGIQVFGGNSLNNSC